ncbi:nicotinate-nucleotide--dimethylbenzimidazole phosphoribosyltransferase [Salinisphaera sp.]|uniref:nicotinate-nucleotide--dimethylbenzimidazole phosphoribosyltransferase n=1 Tax=Salinisphaera sp. TaxID=1914330 RepID=UPI000C49914F|nr:nicotinate-nucleotide--dimethylbenzimidazole phosphoribosyltransferase [Salinisphaera sp.]MBS63685.1 nicotinate-nucleotide--dimethylbenzimidazole phosphoribosyltransferase [Salinisphaera sp.]
MTDWLQEPIAPIDEAARAGARARQAMLTKPPGSLGRLEGLAESFAGWQGQSVPVLDDIDIVVFAADHGVAARGVSAFDQAVTGQMIANFAAGGAAICVLARRHGARLSIVDLGAVAPPADGAQVIDARIRPGTADFTEQAAMQAEELAQALQAGRERVSAAAQLFIGGEMGIGNTTSAAAVLAGLTGATPGQVVGHGTGIDAAGLARKQAVVEAGLARHRTSWDGVDGSARALSILRCVGGFEIAALTGAFVAAAQAGVPVLVDGFIASVAALCAREIAPGCAQWQLFGHRSAEAGHRYLLLDILQARPLLDLDMRLGEGSGAALALAVIGDALALHAGMATFDEAGVTNRDG